MTDQFVQRLNDDLADLIERAQSSLVVVRSGWRGAGAGVVVNDGGLVLTAAHVLGRGPLEVTLPDRTRASAQVLAYDAGADLAALSIPPRGLTAMEMGDSSALRPGELVLALGHPLGVRGAVTAGSVISVGPSGPSGRGGRRDWLTASLHLRPGHSGGPMIDTHGRLVGISTIMAGPDVGMAVPVHVVKAFLKEAVRSERTVLV